VELGREMFVEVDREMLWKWIGVDCGIGYGRCSLNGILCGQCCGVADFTEGVAEYCAEHWEKWLGTLSVAYRHRLGTPR
jgi:hypothetical protein